MAEQAEIGEVEAHGSRCQGFALPSNSTKQSYAKYLLSAKCLRAIFAIDESTARRGGRIAARGEFGYQRNARRTENNNGRRQGTR
jgi:hypothetical protein